MGQAATPDRPPTGRDRSPPGAEHEGWARARRARGRNLALLAALLAFIVLIYLVTLVRLGGLD